MADVIVTSLKKIVADEQLKLPSDLPVLIKWDRKDSEVINYKVKLVEDVVEGSVSFNIVDSTSLEILQGSLTGMVLMDGIYDNTYTVQNYNMTTGLITLSSPLLRDLSADETFDIDVVNMIKILEAPSTPDKTKQTDRNMRVRKKPFDIIISCKDDSSLERIERFARWINRLFSNEHYRCYDADGDAIGTQIFYKVDDPSFENISKEVNNSLYLGRARFMIYEDYCYSLSQI